MTQKINPENPLFIKAQQNEITLIDYIGKCWDCNIIRTPSYSSVDAILYKGSEMLAVAEIKTRNLSLSKMQNEYDNKAIVRFDKIENGKRLSELLSVPYLIVNYFTESGEVFYWKMTDAKGFVICNFEAESMYVPTSIDKTQRAVRMNVKLNLDNAKKIDLETIFDHNPTEEELTALQLTEADPLSYKFYFKQIDILQHLILLLTIRNQDAEKHKKKLKKYDTN